jgi:hypothetical protein
LRKELFVFLILLILAGAYLPAQNPYIRHYTTTDGLPSNAVYQVYQDSHKFIWFATEEGVARYDGSQFTYFRKQDGLSSNDVVRIKEDTQGRIWFFNMNAALNFYKDGVIYNEKNAPYLDSLRSKEFFRDFFEDDDKTLYFYYNYQREIYSLDAGNNITKYYLPSNLINNAMYPESYEGMVIRYLNKDTSGKFILWTIAGLYVMDSLKANPVLKEWIPRFKALFPLKTDRIYAAVGELLGDSKINYKLVRYSKNALLDTTMNALPLYTSFISCVMEDKDGFVWVSTFDQGVDCYNDNKIIRHFDIREAQAVIQDHGSNIWISSLSNGVYKINPYINKHLHYGRDNFQDEGIFALTPHHREGIWCTNGQTFFLLRDQIIYSSDFRNESGSFNQILQVGDNSLIIGEISTRHYALRGIEEDNRAGKIRLGETKISYRPMKKLVFNPIKNAVISYDAFAIILIDPDKLFDEYIQKPLNERVYNIFYNAKGDFIVNMRKNLIYMHDSILPYPNLSCFDNKIITDHMVLDSNNELFNIGGDSLYLSNGGRFINLTSAFTYPVDLQIKHMDYHDSVLFMATTRNIFMCNHPLGIFEGKPVEMMPVDISFRNIRDFLIDDEMLYIASDDGLTVIPYPAVQTIRGNSPISYIKSIRINNETKLDNPYHVNLKGPNRIHFEYGSINYSFCPVIYSYKMEGIDADWTAGTGNDVVYQALPRGNYIFKLRVRKPTSGWSEPVECPITIRATFWQHPLFFSSLSVIIACLVVFIILWRKNATMRRREIEHQLVLLEQKALQSMMNPHFIFNTLGSIQNYLLQSKPGDAGIYLSQFARLMRQNLNAINTAEIGLEEEVDRLKNYMDLEKLRLEGKFVYHLDIDDSLDSEEVLIPSMIIQPFVENAIWHGIANIEEQGVIRIKFRMHDEKSMEITIEDNGIGMANAEKFSVKGEKHLKLGMQMTRKRLELLGKKYKVDTTISFSEVSPGSPNPGTRVALVVPFLLS